MVSGSIENIFSGNPLTFKLDKKIQIKVLMVGDVKKNNGGEKRKKKLKEKKREPFRKEEDP